MAVEAGRSVLNEAYREASGIAYLAEVNAARKSLAEASLLEKGMHLARTRSMTINYDWKEEDRRKGLGMRWLDRLTREKPSQYPRGSISYVIDGDYNRQTFDYALIFPGERVGEEGEVALNQRKLGYTPRPIWLKRGSEPVVEIIANGAHVLHLPEGEGIIWKPEIDRSVHWAYSGDRIDLATWYPDLSDAPQPFRHPEGGRFVWNTGHQL